MALSATVKLGLLLPILLIACFAGAHALFYETWRDVSFTAVESQRVPMLGGLQSYMSVAEFEQHLSSIGAPPHEVTNEQQPMDEDDQRPPFKHTFIDVEGFSDLGHTGNLTAHFFNDRLVEVWFETPDLPGYFARLREQHGLPAEGGPDVEHGHLHLRLITGAAGKVFADDMRLTDEMKLWVKRYS